MKLWSISMALAFAGAAHGAENCEALRSQIEAKIAASGVTRFSVTTIDANAQVTGQVVGSCDLGSKKIVYQREGAPPADGATARPAPAPAGERILTECKDGTVTVGGSCKQ